MIFYEKQTLIGLFLASLPGVLSLYFFYMRDQKKSAIALLLLSAFLLRLLMISLDPYLHEWDERFHALVAKNMIEHPFKPMLFAHHVSAYDPADWGNNHIWLHKQPLFLWQMAISMKFLCVNLFAMRLPSAVMGTVSVWLIYDIAHKWLRDDRIAFLAAAVSAFGFYSLELTSGRIGSDHNDVAFTFYMTCCFWAFIRYWNSGFRFYWVQWIGLFSGLAILNKWLVGLLIFGGWAVFILLSPFRADIRKYIHLMFAMLMACVVFLPWQIYISHAFQVESTIEFAHNRMHLSESFDHPGSVFFHLLYLPVAYGNFLIFPLCIGICSVFKNPAVDKKITISFLAMVFIVFVFFSIFVPTKMTAYVYPVSAIIITLTGLGIFRFWQWIVQKFNLSGLKSNTWLMILTLFVLYFSLLPLRIGRERWSDNQERNRKINNTLIIKSLDDLLTRNRIIYNCRPYENIDLMFYKNAIAYPFCPTSSTLDSIQNLGYRIAAFQYATQPLPEYMVNDTAILVLTKELR